MVGWTESNIKTYIKTHKIQPNLNLIIESDLEQKKTWHNQIWNRKTWHNQVWNKNRTLHPPSPFLSLLPFSFLFPSSMDNTPRTCPLQCPFFSYLLNQNTKNPLKKIQTTTIITIDLDLKTQWKEKLKCQSACKSRSRNDVPQLC